MLIMAPFFLAAVATQPLIGHGEAADLLFHLGGWVLFLTGATFRMWSTLYIGGRKGQSLVCDGPYSMTRNPLYFGTFLISLSIVVWLRSLTFGVGLFMATLVYLQTTVLSEERRLLEKLGASYAAYLARVPRFFPKWKLFQSTSAVEVDVRCLGIETLRAARFACVPVVIEALVLLRDQAWWPHSYVLP